MKTLVYVDASNIRNACSRSSLFTLDFSKLITYLKGKYEGLTVKYFEGIGKGDESALIRMMELDAYGYDVYALERKCYKDGAVYKELSCSACGNKESVKALEAQSKLKSNIDVYLCSELMGDLIGTIEDIHIILVSCDGDYAEMIKVILSHYSNISVSVLATPRKKNPRMNYLSSRFGELDRLPRFNLINIENIKDYVKK